MKLKPQFRMLSASLARAADSEESSDTVEFSFSSEEPVSRWYGEEVLSHEKSAVNLKRLKDGANLLWNHNRDDVIGVVEDAWIGDDKRLYARTRWGTSAKALEIRKDVEAGVIRNVSFGYQIDELKLENPKDDDSRYLATKWMPFEVSFVSIPADQTVGMGRAHEGEEREVPVINEVSTSENPSPEEQPAKEAQSTTTGVRVMDPEMIKKEREAERARIAAITALGEKHNQKDLARQLIEGEKSIDEARAAILEKIEAGQKPVDPNAAVIGLTPKEVRKFSFLKALNALGNPNDKRAQDAAGFERECSAAAEKLGGKASRGLMVPVDVLREAIGHASRNLVVGTPTAGGNLVATELLSGSFIELLRNRMAVQRLGAQVLNGLTGNIAIPKQTGAATAYWVGEDAAPTESQQTIGQVTMSPKTVGAWTDFSRKLVLQSSIDVESMVRNDLASVLGLAIDLAALYGIGSSNEPLGLFETANIKTVDFTNSAPTWAEIVDMESKVAGDNADIGVMKYLTNAKGRGLLKTTDKASGAAQFIMDSNSGLVNGYAAEFSNQVKTLSSTDPDFFFGVWSNMILGFWSGLDLLVDPYTGGKEGTMRVIAHQDVDVAVRYAESFCYGNKTIA